MDNSSEPAADFVDLLADTIWGTPGKTRYQHLDTRHRIRQLQRPRHIMLSKAGQVRAGMTLCQRATQEARGQANTFYIRYFSFAEQLRNQQPANYRLSPTGESMIRRGSLIKNHLYGLFRQPDLVARPLANTQDSLFYAYVESENRRSLQICNAFGFQRVRSFVTLPFSRFFQTR